MKTRDIIFPLIALATASLAMLSCSRNAAIPEEADADRTVTVKFTPSISSAVSEGDIPVKSAEAEIGQCDIWCFVRDEDTGSWVEGYPMKQTEIIGNTYSFVIPGLRYVRLFFAIMPENASWNYTSYSQLEFYVEDIFDESNLIWCSQGQNLYPEGSDTITLENIKLRQRHKDFRFTFECRDFPSDPAGFIRDIALKVYGETYPKVLEFGSLETFTDNSGTEKYYYDFTVMKDGTSSFWSEVYLTTSKGETFSYYGDVNGSYDSYVLNYEISYDKIDGYYNY